MLSTDRNYDDLIPLRIRRKFDIKSFEFSRSQHSQMGPNRNPSLSKKLIWFKSIAP